MKRYCTLYPYIKRILNKGDKMGIYSYTSSISKTKDKVYCSRHSYLCLKLWYSVEGLTDKEYNEYRKYNKVYTLYKCLNYKY